MMERRLDKMRLCALLIDATPFAGQQMLVALGISQDGRKTILGIRQGATENATVVGELLGDLMNRGLDFAELRLYILDGGKSGPSYCEYCGFRILNHPSPYRPHFRFATIPPILPVRSMWKTCPTIIDAFAGIDTSITNLDASIMLLNAAQRKRHRNFSSLSNAPK
jgi:hypothetical protein